MPNRELTLENETALVKLLLYLFFKTIYGFFSYPFVYAQALMQLGYEPSVNSLDGWHVNILTYLSHIGHTDGFLGLYRGFSAYLAEGVLRRALSSQIYDILGLIKWNRNGENNRRMSLPRYELFQMDIKHEVSKSIIGTAVSYPLHVIMLRLMAEFLGEDKKCSTLLGCFFNTIQREGPFALYKGLLPALLYDICHIVLLECSAYLVHDHLLENSLERIWSSEILYVCYGLILYPLKVCSTCTAVAGVQLAALEDSHIHTSTWWLRHWNNLQQERALTRGRNFLFYRRRCISKFLHQYKYQVSEFSK